MRQVYAPVADPAIAAGTAEPRRQGGTEQQMIDAQPRILLPVLTEIIPEGVDTFVLIASAHGIGPSLSKQALIALAAFRLQQRILQPRTGVVNILIGRNDVVVARKHYWMTAVVKLAGVVDQPFEPGQFVVEFGTGLRVAVR